MRASARRWPGSAETWPNRQWSTRARVHREQHGGRGGRHIAVDDHRHALVACGDDRPGHRRELAAADPAEHLERVREAPAWWKASAASTASRFRARPSSSTPVPRPTQSRGRAAEQRGEDRGGDRGVADPHLADAEEVDAARHRLHAEGHGRGAVGLVQRRPRP